MTDTNKMVLMDIAHFIATILWVVLSIVIGYLLSVFGLFLLPFEYSDVTFSFFSVVLIVCLIILVIVNIVIFVMMIMALLHRKDKHKMNRIRIGYCIISVFSAIIAVLPLMMPVPSVIYTGITICYIRELMKRENINNILDFRRC